MRDRIRMDIPIQLDVQHQSVSSLCEKQPVGGRGQKGYSAIQSVPANASCQPARLDRIE